MRGIEIAATLVVVLLRLFAMFFGGLPGVSLSVVVRSFTALLAALMIHTRRSMRCVSLDSQRNTPPIRTQRAPYTIAPIAQGRVFESNDSRRANQHADTTFSNSTLVEFGLAANMAA